MRCCRYASLRARAEASYLTLLPSFTLLLSIHVHYSYMYVHIFIHKCKYSAYAYVYSAYIVPYATGVGIRYICFMPYTPVTLCTSYLQARRRSLARPYYRTQRHPEVLRKQAGGRSRNWPFLGGGRGSGSRGGRDFRGRGRSVRRAGERGGGYAEWGWAQGYAVH